MRQTYLVTFHPSGPYFFGNDRIFRFRGDPTAGRQGDGIQTNPYYIVGENLPLQSTVFGAMRYLMLPEKGYDRVRQYADVIGPESYLPGKEELQQFGIIRSISPIFLYRECDGECFIPTPFDHAGGAVYHPFSNYRAVNTPEGEQYYTGEYHPKEYKSGSWMSLKDGSILTGLFSASVRIGINRGIDKEGFFKRSYVRLDERFSFAVLAELEKDIPDGTRDLVMLGQGKVPFTVRFTQYDGERLETRAASLLWRMREAVCVQKDGAETKLTGFKTLEMRYNPGFPAGAYPLTFTINGLYRGIPFAVTQTRSFRPLRTQGSSLKKDPGCRYLLLKAGSILIPGEKYTEQKQTIALMNASTIGMNRIVSETTT